MDKLKEWWRSPSEKKWLSWLAKVLWICAIAGVIFSVIVFIVVGRSDLPGFDELENPQYDLASIIYDVNEVPFGKYYIENREFIDFNDLSPHVYNALISVEDVRYHNHSGN